MPETSHIDPAKLADFLNSMNANVHKIFNHVDEINDVIHVVQNGVNGIEIRQGVLELQLQGFSDEFKEFIKADSKHKALALAETRVIKLQQELQSNFGFYAEVRRMATGILQGVDVGIVSDDTLRNATEEVAIKAPGYWLAPTLVAIASWIRNDKVTCTKALSESLRRDDYKSTLFFMLVMRRLSRNDASMKWLERYFMHQTPHDLDREFIIILEAITTGVFPPASRQLMMGECKKWLDQLTESDDFVGAQRTQWVGFFGASRPQLDEKYPLLTKFATNWRELQASMATAHSHAVIHAYFEGVFASSANYSKQAVARLDEILSLLVTNFDDEELPLQEAIRLNELIIQKEGDKDLAHAMMNAEQSTFKVRVDFLQLLTNAAFNPELSGATKVTQALAVSIGQPWIIAAYDTFTAQARSKTPQTIDLVIDGFSASTKDGSDEKALLAKQDGFYKSRLKMDLDKLPFPYAMVAIGSLIALACLWESFSNWIFAVGAIIGAIMAGKSIFDNNKAKATITANLAQRKKQAKGVLRGCIAEAVDYRKEHAMEDQRAEGVRQLLASITVENFSSLSTGVARNII